MNPAQTAAKASTAENPCKNMFPPVTAPLVCVGLGLFVLVPISVNVDEGDEEEETPPATSFGVVEFVVFEAANA